MVKNNVDWAKYIGIPYKSNGRYPDKALDCWGFLGYFFANELGIVLPAYRDLDANSKATASQGLLNTDLYQVSTKVSTQQPLDILLFNVNGIPIHTGIVVDDTVMIHSDRKTGSVIESYRSPKWAKRLYETVRLDGINSSS